MDKNNDNNNDRQNEQKGVLRCQMNALGVLRRLQLAMVYKD